jgi:hypothetical protein
MGKPTVVVTTTKFLNLTKRVAANFGLPEARICVVEHPLGGTDDETIVAWADAAVDEIIELFTQK